MISVKTLYKFLTPLIGSLVVTLYMLSVFSIAAGLAFAFLVNSLLIMFWGVKANPSRQIIAEKLILTMGLVFLLISRWKSFEFDRIINPDEAVMAANTLLAHHGWLNWNLNDTLTAGPLNSMVLEWPSLWGGDVTLFSTRLTGVVLLALSFICLQGAINALCKNRWTILSVVPIYGFMIYTASHEFLHYTSGLLPVLLISAGLYFYATGFRIQALWPLCVSAFLLGCVPFAKLQGAPVALVLGCFVLFRAFTMPLTGLQRMNRLLSVMVAACLPALLFLGPVLVLCGLDDFLKSYLVQQHVMISASEWRNNVPIIWMANPDFAWLAKVYACAGLFALLACVADRRCVVDEAVGDSVLHMAGLTMALIPASYFSIAAPGRPSSHYLLFGIPALVLLGAVSITAIANFFRLCKKNGVRLAMCTAIILVALDFAAMLLNLSTSASIDVASMDERELQGMAFTAPRLLQWLRPTQHDHLLCWGWAAECYLDAAITPATRETSNVNQLFDASFRGYFRARLLQDLDKSQPDFIVDTAVPDIFNVGFANSQFFNGLRTNAHFASDIAVFPELQELVNRDYRLMTSVKHPENCPRMYVKKSRADLIDAELVPIASITADKTLSGYDPASLNNGNVFESCPEVWLAPDSTVATLTIKLQSPSQIKSIAILNTRRNTNSSKTATIKLISQNHVAKILNVTINPFPWWTVIGLTDPIANVDEIELDILASAGNRAGLTQVKVYRR